jgi:peptidoglycan-associated lipoprotein
MKHLLVLLSLCFTGLLFSQESLVEGNEYFAEGNYHKAIPFYEKAYKKKAGYESAYKLAKCFLDIDDYESAIKWSEIALRYPYYDPKIRYDYAVALKTFGNYEDAKKEFINYGDEFPAEADKATLWANYCDSAKLWSELEISDSVFSMPWINTVGSEISPMWRNDELIICSSLKTQQNFWKVKSQQTGLYFYSMYAPQKINEDSTFFKLISCELPDPYHEGAGSFNRAGDTVFYTAVSLTQRSGMNKLDIVYGVYEDGIIKDTKVFTYNTADNSEGHPFLSKDGQRLYFVSDQLTGYGGSDIYMCQKINGKWSNPVNLGPNVNSAYDDFYPHEKNPGELYFSSERPDGFGGLDIYSAKKVNNTWMVGKNLMKPINSSYDDFSISFFPDSNLVYFSSNRPGGKGNDDIYGVYIRPAKLVLDKPLIAENTVEDEVEKSLKIDNLRVEEKTKVETTLMVKGTVVEAMDDNTEKPIAYATVVMIGKQSGNQQKTIANNKGQFEFERKTDEVYTIRASKDGYFTNALNVKLNNNDSSVAVLKDNEIIKNVEYDFNSFKLKPNSLPQLDKVVRLMKAKPNYVITLRSYSDNRGKASYNLPLSQNRANSVKQYLILQGISSSRITVQGLGETDLIVPNAETEEEHQLNRRTEFKLTIKN